MYCRCQSLLVLFTCLGAFKLPAANGESAASESKLTIRRDIRAIIDQSLPRDVVPSISRSKHITFSRRLKRSPSTRELEDPNNCIHKCWDADDERTEQVQTNFENKVHDTDKISEDPSSQKTQLNLVMNNVGSLMTDACQSARKTKSCFQACPNSQLKDVAIADYTVEDVACEPEKNFGGYSNYRLSVYCINNTMSVSREYCASQCHGEVRKLREVTQFALDRNETDSSAVYVETDSNQNTNKVRDQCKITTCIRECNKKYLFKRCGQKGYDLYARQLKIEPKSTLAILQRLNVLSNVPSECDSLK